MALSNLSPYISPAELINGNTGIDWNSIPLRGSTAQAQTDVQTEVCWQVTDRIDAICEQVMRSTVNTETQRGPDFWFTVDSHTGEACFTTARWFVLQVISGQWTAAGTYPPQWTAIAQNQMWVDDIQGYIGGAPPGGSGSGSNKIYMAPGLVDWRQGRNGYRVQVKYVSLFPNSGITASGPKPTGPVAGDTSIHVDDIAGWGSIPSGFAGRIFDPPNSEGIMATGVTPDAAGALNGPGTITLASPLLYSHGLNVRVSTMPSTFQRAALDLATVYARRRGATAIRAQTSGGSASATFKGDEELETSAELALHPYKRVI